MEPPKLTLNRLSSEPEMAFDEVKKLYSEACIMKNNLDMGKPLPEGWSEQQIVDNF